MRLFSKKNFFISFFFILLSTLSLIFTKKSFAQQTALSISPPVIEVFIQPGKTILIAYDLVNEGDPLILSSKIVSFEPVDVQGKIRINEDLKGPIQFALENTDLKLNQPFFLKSKEKIQLLLRIRVPVGALEGDYYHTLIVESQPPNLAQGQLGSTAKISIGAHLILTVTKTGQVEIKGKIPIFEPIGRLKFSIGNREINIFDSNDKIPITLIVENNGKNLFKTEGEINLKGPLGEKATYKIHPQNVLAYSQKLIQATPSAFLDCENKDKTLCGKPISLVIKGFFLGFYQLSASINLGENAPKIFSQTSFIALPFRVLIAVLISITIIYLLIKRLSQ